MKRNQKYLLPVLLLVLLLTACGKKEDTAGTQGEMAETATAGEQKAGIEFPYQVDHGNLVINSLFQSSIENPDCKNEYADDVASLEIVNQSNRYLESAKLTLHMKDGKKCHMVVENIPAGKKVWVFDNKNQAITNDAVCISIDCDTKYLTEPPMESQQISVSVDETEVTLKNKSEKNLSGLTVGCHCMINGVYYGGLTYSYPIKKLSANGSEKIKAEDCFLGEAEVVRISK